MVVTLPNRAGAFTRLHRRRLEFEGGPAGYLERGAGDGTPVLMIHGFCADLLTWQFNLSALASGRRVVAIDLPGHGSSVADVGDGRVESFIPWLERVLDALDLPRVHVVGHSMGGRVALLMAERAPARVAGLTLIACAGLSPTFDLDYLRRLISVATADEAVACAARLFGRPSPYAELMSRGLLARAAVRAPLEAILENSFVPEAARSLPPTDWARIGVPVQVIWGREDSIIPVPPAGWLPEHAMLHVLDGVGHLPHLEAASQVNALIAGLLTGDRGAGRAAAAT